jgi:D-aminoacyl-tRNA deacylase
MRAVVQRVSSAAVSVDGALVGRIERGFLVLLGVKKGDGDNDAGFLAQKIAKLRIFSDENGKMNLALAEVGGAVLSVSQFTLYGDVRAGNRPSFIAAAGADEGRRLYQVFNEQLRALGLRVETGVFQAAMQVTLINDGPVTLVIDSP